MKKSIEFEFSEHENDSLFENDADQARKHRYII